MCCLPKGACKRAMDCGGVGERPASRVRPVLRSASASPSVFHRTDQPHPSITAERAAPSARVCSTWGSSTGAQHRESHLHVCWPQVQIPSGEVSICNRCTWCTSLSSLHARSDSMGRWLQKGHWIVLVSCQMAQSVLGPSPPKIEPNVPDPHPMFLARSHAAAAWSAIPLSSTSAVRCGFPRIRRSLQRLIVLAAVMACVFDARMPEGCCMEVLGLKVHAMTVRLSAAFTACCAGNY